MKIKDLIVNDCVVKELTPVLMGTAVHFTDGYHRTHTVQFSFCMEGILFFEFRGSYYAVRVDRNLGECDYLAYRVCGFNLVLCNGNFDTLGGTIPLKNITDSKYEWLMVGKSFNIKKVSKEKFLDSFS